MSSPTTPYQQGKADAEASRPRARPFPRGDATWADRLYDLGYTEGNPA
jgi:hypothetical protein